MVEHRPLPVQGSDPGPAGRPGQVGRRRVGCTRRLGLDGVAAPGAVEGITAAHSPRMLERVRRSGLTWLSGHRARPRHARSDQSAILTPEISRDGLRQRQACRCVGLSPPGRTEDQVERPTLTHQLVPEKPLALAMGRKGRGLRVALVLDISLDNLQGCPCDRGHEVAIGPQGGDSGT